MYRNVMVMGISKWDHPVWTNPEQNTIFAAMQEYLTQGVTTEILAVYSGHMNSDGIFRACHETNEWERPDE